MAIVRVIAAWVWIFAVGLEAQQAPGGLVPPSGAVLSPLAKGSVEIPPPTKPELEPTDFKLLADLLLKQQAAWLEFQRKRADALEAEKRANDADKSVLDLLSKFREHYQCQACDLSWQGKWSPPGNVKFTETKPEDKAAKVK